MNIRILLRQLHAKWPSLKLQLSSSELSGITSTAAVNLPSMRTHCQHIRAPRQERNIPPHPINRAAIPVLPLVYQEIETREDFLFYDSGVGDADTIFIFSSQQANQFLSNSEHWFADCTFKVCPELFYEVYVVHAEGRVFPCVFGLLPNKTETTCTRFFQEIFYRFGPPRTNNSIEEWHRSFQPAIQIFGNSLTS